MKYAVWFVRLIFAAWMIPAGLNHFLPLFPQPMGSQPLSMELIVALLDSRLFDIVKGVELIAGIGALFGFFTPLALLICLPVSFGVFYWDAPLEGWTSGASTFGYATLLCNSLLCLAYYKYYLPMFTVKTEVNERKQLVMGARLVLGALVVLYSVYVLFLSSPPAGSQPLSEMLMTSLTNSRLLHVALVVQLVAGVLLLANIMVPAALCVQMMISANALFWGLFLDQSLVSSLGALVVFGLNGLLMLAYLPYYRDVLQRYSFAVGEERGTANYDALMVNNDGTTSKDDYIPAMATVLVSIAFYSYYVPGGSGIFSMFVLLYPLFTLLIRRFRDMGQHPWWLFIPVMMMLMYFDIWLGYFSFSESVAGTSFNESVNDLFSWCALLVTAGFVVWGAAASGKDSSPVGGT